MKTVDLQIPPERLGRLLLLLQDPFGFETDIGVSLRDFLCTILGLAGDYVEHTILSIVLDGGPVDDLDDAVLRDGSRLALSSGMPGLAGATLRRGSPLASFRYGITHRETDAVPPRGPGRITVKLFNIVLNDVGPIFLRRGIILPLRHVRRVIEVLPGPQDDRVALHIDGKKGKMQDLIGDIRDQDNDIRLVVRTDEP